MTDEFANLPPPTGSVAQRQDLDKKVNAWMHEMEIKIAQLDKALAEVLNPDLSTNHALAKKRVEHEMNRLKELTKAILNGLERT